MSNGINKAIIMGKISDDPFYTTTHENIEACYFHVATHFDHFSKETGKKTKGTVYHKICLYGRMADEYASLIKQGTIIAIEGYMRYRKFKTKSDQLKLMLEVVAEKADIVDISCNNISQEQEDDFYSQYEWNRT